MKNLALKILLFVLFNLLIIIGILEYLHIRDIKLKVHPSVTESVVLGMDQGEHYNWLIMGSSHGRNMIRGQNYFNLHSKTKKKIACLAQTGAGLYPEYLWLKYFYSSDNKADTILYILDPFVFYTQKWNEDLQFLSNEPFRWELFKLVLTSRTANEVKFNYVKSKFQQAWLSRRGVFIQDEEGSLTGRNPEAVRKRVESLYPDGYSLKTFVKYTVVLQDIIQMAKLSQSKIIFILPPTLLGDTPGYRVVVGLLQNLQAKGEVTYFDFSNSITDPAKYYNHDHLNSRGMDLYISNCLSLVF